MTHGSFFCRPSSILILVAECSEGAGSKGYLDFMNGVTSIEEVIQKFAANEFSVGPHKAFQIARILEKHKVYLISSMPDDVVKSLLLEPLHSNIDMDKFIQKHIPPHGRIAVLPYATACIPTK
jgi:nickel-dependent lactate racemase